MVVQNAGGLTSLEAMASGVPVLSYRCLPGHGITNAAALDEAGLAVWIREESRLAPVLAATLANASVPLPPPAQAADLTIAALAGGAPSAPVSALEVVA